MMRSGKIRILGIVLCSVLVCLCVFVRASAFFTGLSPCKTTRSVEGGIKERTSSEDDTEVSIAWACLHYEKRRSQELAGAIMNWHMTHLEWFGRERVFVPNTMHTLGIHG